MRKYLLRTAAIATAAGLLLAGCSNGGEEGDGDSGETLTLRVSHVNPPDSIDGQIIDEVAQTINEKSGGSLELEVYPSGQIGTTGDTAEQAANGENVIGYMDASIIAQLGAEDFGILGGPFLFDDLDGVNNFLASDLFTEMSDQVAESQGIRILSLGWVDGPRHIFGKEAYPDPSDLQGVKFRTPPVDVWTETFSLLGAVPTEVANTETYSALEQGVVDAAEGPINGTYPQRWQEPANQVTLTGHFRTLIGYGMSEQVWQSLTPEQQDLLREEFTAGGEEAQAGYEAAIEETMQKMEEEAQVEFHEADIDAYREQTAPFYEQYGDLYDRVREASQG